MSKTVKRRLWLIPTVLVLSVASCNGNCERAAHEAIQALAIVFIIVLVIGACVSLLTLAATVGGIATTVINLSQPTRRSRLWGIIFGAINAVLGLGAFLSVASVPFQEQRHAAVDPMGLIFGVLVTFGWLALGVGGTVVAVRAKPKEEAIPAPAPALPLGPPQGPPQGPPSDPFAGGPPP